MARINNWFSDDWCSDKHARSQEELQKMVASIRKNCKLVEVGVAWGQTDDTHIYSIYENKNLGIRYTVHDTLGNVSSITEERD